MEGSERPKKDSASGLSERKNDMVGVVLSLYRWLDVLVAEGIECKLSQVRSDVTDLQIYSCLQSPTTAYKHWYRASRL